MHAALLRWSSLFICALTAPAVAASELPREQLDFFEARIRPLFIEHCYACHSAAAGEKLKAGFRLDTRDGIRRGGDSGAAAVVPGDADRSRLIAAVRWSDPDFQMPPKKKLSDRQIADLIEWINLGAPDPRDAAPAGGDGAGAKAPP